MRRKGLWTFTFLFAAAALSARAGQAQTTTDLYSINVDENGNGSWVEYSPPVVGAPFEIGSGSLASAPIPGGGLSYVLPYTININENSNQWLGIYDLDGVTKSDLIHFANVPQGSGTVGVLDFYSKDMDGDLADVNDTVWSSIVGNWDGFTTSENADGLAFYSTYLDTGGVPGDPHPHPAIEATYYFNSGAVPEPTVIGLLLAGSGLLLARRPRWTK